MKEGAIGGHYCAGQGVKKMVDVDLNVTQAKSERYIHQARSPWGVKN